ncbi:glycosyltransferase family 4 protein [Sneathiella marina]|uniref:Glycosyltransferase family 4 protein n=1 Tax=Sneathiella marina TaxID=2950108 RepID=A0ABY4W504_9PROT|nr:glycosyltransferase family 4 protein [Sneathiella marina]USG61178.1 glycosyltransferase family 4 protein [Sneathiella marina]
MKLAFYAPMKPPDHPTPSGDRRMGRLLWKALENAGFDLELVSRLRSLETSGDAAIQAGNERKGRVEAERLVTAWRADPAQMPEGWFTYHVYHKSPDWIGPYVCEKLNIPYFIAEASHAPKQANGPWKPGYDAAARAITQAACVFHMTNLDGACLKSLIADDSQLVFLPPFLDTEAFLTEANENVRVEDLVVAAGGQRDKKNLLAVAMMRSGDKFMSYEQIGLMLPLLKTDDWQLLIVGDGDRREDIEKLLSPFVDRIVYLGQQPSSILPAVYRFADVYVWPAHGEAYGMAFLEAQVCGLPVVAGKIRGVPDVVKDGQTGLLTEEGDFGAFAEAVDFLLASLSVRGKMSEAAHQFVRSERGLEKAAKTLKHYIGKVLK